jgi:hypothetical protein
MVSSGLQQVSEYLLLLILLLISCFCRIITTDDEILAAIRAESWVSVLFPENTVLTLSSVYLQQQEQQPARAATRYLQLQFIVTHKQIRMMQATMSVFCIHRLLLKETVTNLMF